MITCSTCLKEKEESSFTRNKSKRIGYNKICKPCRVTYRLKYRESNAEKLRVTGLIYYNNNKEACNNRNKKWRDANSETNLLRKRLWKIDNKEIVNACNARRRAVTTGATPLWYNKEEVIEIYKQASDNNLVVDHIVPLRSKEVCGLNVQDNLRCISKELNAVKSNRYWSDMWDSNKAKQVLQA